MRCWVLLIAALYILLLPQLVFAQTESIADPDPPHSSLDESDGSPIHTTADFDDRVVISTPSPSSPPSSQPTSASPSSTPPASSSSHSLFISAPSSSKRSSRTHTPQHTTIPHPHTLSPTKVTPHDRPPPPTARPAPQAPTQEPTQRTSSHQPVVAIVFEVIAGVTGLLIIASVSRCIYSWQRTPSRDRIAALLSRHQLEREMEELEREQMERRRRQWRGTSFQAPPPPPYQRAPSYETLPGVERV